jgi:hypothetical protein
MSRKKAPSFRKSSSTRSSNSYQRWLLSFDRNGLATCLCSLTTIFISSSPSCSKPAIKRVIATTLYTLANHRRRRCNHERIWMRKLETFSYLLTSDPYHLLLTRWLLIQWMRNPSNRWNQWANTVTIEATYHYKIA